MSLRHHYQLTTSEVRPFPVSDLWTAKVDRLELKIPHGKFVALRTLERSCHAVLF
jgi:hypothetical protein